MEVHFGPNAVDEPSLLYKLQRKIKVFNTNNPLSNRGYNLVSCTSKYGLVFIASPNGILSVYYLKELINKECEPQNLSIKLQLPPTHISVNSNQEWLAVYGGQMLLVYKCMDFHNPEIRPTVSIKCDVNPETFVSALQWNPCIPDTIGIVFFDGTILVSQVSTMQMIKIQSNARCLCWSPKGKQLVTGNNDGTLTQYKPDLSQMKMVPAPNLYQGSPVEVLTIYWISTYQFAVAYRNAAENTRPDVTIVNTPKGGVPSFWNYEDICYSMGNKRPWYYYLHGLTPWNLIITSSSNSVEIATLSTPDGSNWVQWCQTDEARPELPLTDKKQENYPVGICIDTAAVHQLPWGENETLPPMPLMHVVAQTGWLSIFNIINFNKSAPQICAPIQPLILPAAALTRNIPDDVPVQQQEQQPPFQQQQPQPPAQLQQPMQQPQIMQPMQPSPQPQIQQQTMAPKPVPQLSSGAFQPTPTLPPYTAKKESTPPATAEATSIPQTQSKSTIQVPKPQSAEVNAALKLEQEKINKAKANQELKNMLIKEVNDFQMELYKFMKLTQERQQKFQQDILSVNLNMQLDMDTEKLKKECSIEDLRETIIQLKLELVRACAVVAEARTHAEIKDHQEWTQIDPLTAKRVASVKKVAYYVQNQLDQARKALDHKWNEMINRDQYSKPGERMIRPILDDVYQPLVKQQEILSRQQAVLKTLRNTMNECNFTPTFRSTSLLRSTPFRKKDPLSKLTKNILNMSIEPQNKAKDQFLSSQKLDALRDFLSNHKPIKIKPASVELTQHLENMKKKYEQSVKDREIKQQESKKAEVKQEIVIKQEEPAELLPKPKLPSFPQMPIKSEVKAIAPVIPKVPKPNAPVALKTDANMFKGQPIAYTQPTTPVEIKPDIVKESPVSSYYTPVNFKPAAPVPVVRTLFTDEPKEEKPQEPAQKVVPKQLSEAKPASETTKSLLRQYILKDSQEVKSIDSKNEGTFMGQNICSPTAFTFPKPAATAAPSAVFPSKPITNIFNKSKESGSHPPLQSPINPNDETGETESAIAQKEKPQDKPITNMFSLKTNTLGNKNQNIPDVLQSQSFVFSKVDSKITKPKDEKGESKENVEKSENSVVEKKEDLKPSVAPMSSKAPSQSVIIVDLKKPAAAAKIEKMNSSIFSNNPVSPPPTATKPQQGFVAITTSTSEITEQENSTKLNITISKVSDENPVPEDSNTTSATITISKFKEMAEIKDPKTQTTTVKTDAIESKPSVLSTPTSSTNASVFTSNASVFAPASGTQTSPGSIFAPQTTQGQVFGTQTTTSIFGTSTAQSLFSAAASKSQFATTTTTQSIFGSSTATTQSSAFGSSSVFSAQSPNQVFGSTQSSVFGSATTTHASVFGTTQTTQGSIFGSQSQTTQSSVFGTPTQTTQASVFGTPTQTTQASVFGTPTQTTQASVFGTPTQSSQASVFGTPTPTTQASVFGTPTQTTQASVFGTPTQTTQASVFGTPTQTTQASVFGTPTQTTQASVFGTPTQTTQSSIFGSPSHSTQASVFGTATQATQPSVFGTSAPPTQASVFGTPTTTQSGSIFGRNESDMFASASISTTSASQSGGNIFGGSSGSVFGNTNVFGSKASFTGSSPTAANIFGGSASFGQKPATDFWSGGNSGGFGSTGFGQQGTTQASSIFGSSGGSFSTPSTQPFGSPQPFSENKPSVFGSPQQQSAPAFGGSPVFGSKSVFGGSPGFGSSAFGGFNKSPSSGFGAPATFGGGGFGGAAFGNTSPGKMFGNAPAPGFGSPTQSNATFETLATQNTLTFGNLAQQSGSPQPAPSFNTSPSFTGWRG